MTAEATPRRATDQTPTARFQPQGRRAAIDQLSDVQQFLVDLEQIATDLTAAGQHTHAEKLRNLARRNVA